VFRTGISLGCKLNTGCYGHKSRHYKIECDNKFHIISIKVYS